MIDYISAKIQRINSVKIDRKVMYGFFFLYILLISVVSVFHEPWYDEAQAWQIAKCASVSEIIFQIPHFEGHPPLWHLLLAPFAKCGLPYEFSISLVNILFISAAAWLIMFRTELPPLMRLLMPFTYFFCYQYAVISRPYSVMALAFVLCAVNYRDKKEKPFNMTLSLALLCASSSYGIAYAFFICLAWIYEIWNGDKIPAFIVRFVKSKAFYALLTLLLFAIIMFLLVTPSESSLFSLTADKRSTAGYLNVFAYTVLLLPFDATIGTVITEDKAIPEDKWLSPEFIPYYIVSLAIYALLFLAAKQNKKLHLLLPAVIMPFLFGTIFFFSHHIGLYTLYLLFFLCVCYSCGENAENTVPSDSPVQTIAVSFAYVTVFVQIIWAAASCALEFGRSYTSCRAIADYIKNNDISEAYILPSGMPLENYYCFDSSAYAVLTLPYFDRNIFPSYNFGKDSEGYDHNNFYSEEEADRSLEYVRSLGTPDYIIGVISDSNDDYDSFGETEKKSHLPEDYFDFIYKDVRYIPAESFKNGMIFKGHYIESYDVIFEKVKTDE